VAKLLQQVHAEPPVRAVHVAHVREVGPAVAIENLAAPLVHEREAEADHFLVVDRAAIHRPQSTRDAHH